MDIKYADWIFEYRQRTSNITAKCEEATIEMQESFPELTRKRGHVIGAYSDRIYEHWWLESPDGTLIDPTAIQFGSVTRYMEHDENEPEPIGKCIQCGAYLYPGGISSIACSESCRKKVLRTFERN